MNTNSRVAAALGGRPILPVIALLLGAGLALTTGIARDAEDGRFSAESNLRAGVAKIDITPAIGPGMKVVGHVREVTGVRDPLRAGVLLLDDGETKAAIVTLDTIGAWDEMVKRARERIERETRVPAANIMVAASHNHSAPGYAENSTWAAELIDKLGAAAKEAAGRDANRDDRLRRGSHWVRHQSSQSDRRTRGGAPEPGRTQ